MILQVNEIFESISGEAGWFPQGSWCTFVRLQGCNLHCQWCDTKKALDHFAGMKMSVDEIVAQCKTPRVLITGGEPLMQIDGLEVLLEALIEKADKHVQVETNGSFSIPRWEGVEWVVDYKPPSSGCSLEAHEAFDDGSVLKTESMVTDPLVWILIGCEGSELHSAIPTTLSLSASAATSAAPQLAR